MEVMEVMETMETMETTTILTMETTKSLLIRTTMEAVTLITNLTTTDMGLGGMKLKMIPIITMEATNGTENTKKETISRRITGTENMVMEILTTGVTGTDVGRDAITDCNYISFAYNYS